MNKLFAILFAIMLPLCGIVPIVLDGCSSPFIFNLYGYEVNEILLDEAWARTAAFKYIPDKGNEYKSPIEFERDGGGDCEDFSCYLVYLLGPKASLVTLVNPATGYAHCAVMYEGNYLEPSIAGLYIPSKNVDNMPMVQVVDYWDTMALFTNYGTKGM